MNPTDKTQPQSEGKSEASPEEFEEVIRTDLPDGLTCRNLKTLQVNLGRFCNLSCKHCHLSCSPARQEMMSRPCMDHVLEVAKSPCFMTVDITGGAPELHPDFRDFITRLTRLNKKVLVRTNLVALLESEQEGLIVFLAEHQIELVASMPCYLDENVDAQRGQGVFRKSIQALQALNALGYGRRSEIPLTLVYNPGGAALPGPQAELESAYRRELQVRYGIDFTRLITITNLPIGRFDETLHRQGSATAYATMLRRAYNPDTLEELMCRHQLCVDYDGRLYDCDFNLALGMTVDHGAPAHIEEYDLQTLSHRKIVTGRHCFGCTAGQGSSCGGALTEGKDRGES